MLNTNRYEWLSFDCYGTLIDWETGICRAVSGVLDSCGIKVSDKEILALFSKFEPTVQQSCRYLEYRVVLDRVMVAIGREFKAELDGSDASSLADSLPDWPVFPEVVDVLSWLKSRHRLAVISNVDDDLFALTAQKIGVEFDAVITAQQVGSYKPDLRNFAVAAERMGVEKRGWLHVAESLYHDIAPANRLGIASVWVNRSNRGGGTRHTAAIPDIEVPDLATLAGCLHDASNGLTATHLA